MRTVALTSPAVLIKNIILHQGWKLLFRAICLQSIFLLGVGSLYADCDEEEKEDKCEPEPPKIGNFALPTSQQPAALFGFGGNIIDKGEVQISFFADQFGGKRRNITDFIPGVTFGITDDCSIFFNFGVTPRFRDGIYESCGLEDFVAQFEYAIYNKKTWTYADEATIVLNVTVPTGSAVKVPPTGFGAPSFFIGATYYHLQVDWFAFTAQGAILTTSNLGIKIGEVFLYQFGLGRNIPSPCGWIFAWMVELDGQYNKRNRFDGLLDPNSGGNVIYLTPSFWASSNHFIFQLGLGAPIYQNLFGRQNRFDYTLNLSLAWSFY